MDYSGRSVITVEPTLKLNECGIPIEIAIELFQPYLLKKLLQLKIVTTIRQGKKKISSREGIVLLLLKKVIEKHTILLNRAPTLHRVGIQAFQPKLTNEMSLKLHPLVCSAFNADFDGDQMGIHIPLSLKAQAEARVLMISNNNCTSPANGTSNILLSQDMVLGCYFLTTENNSLQKILKKIKVYNNINKALNDYKLNIIRIQDFVWIKYKIKKYKFTLINRENKKIKKFHFIV